MTEQTSFPTLSILANGSSGIEIRAKLSAQYDCKEFTLRDDVPQPVFISPWMQWEPAAMNNERLQLAFEIARRAMAHDELVKQVAQLQQMLERERKIMDRRQETQWKTYELWGEEREKYGLKKDFTDVKNWPIEMMNGYDVDRVTDIMVDGTMVYIGDKK